VTQDIGQPSVSADVYDAEYFLLGCEGHESFRNGAVSLRLLTGLSMVDIQPGQRVLDIACGRGEAAFWLAERGAWTWGLDYALPALHIAQEQASQRSSVERVRFIAANARVLPFGDGLFDHALMMDVVEHLYPWELSQALCEVYRVLRPGGRLLVHTAPNRWYYRWGYPAFRFTEWVRGRRLPTDPKQRFRYHSLMHVNEQSPRSLRQVMYRAGFRVHVSVDASRTEWERMGKVSRLVGHAATRLPLIKWVICGDIFAVGCKD
jgi:ubiquinone/menaquinone biosynthesis C-methylase UbiE